jgi:hypothetical protein
LFWWINLAAACLHGLNALLMLVFYYTHENEQGSTHQDLCFPINRSYAVWDNATDPPRITYATTTLMHLSLHYTIFFFHLLSCLFQVAPVLLCNKRYKEDVKRGTNPWRFVEYSLSASLMLVAIAVISGVTDFNVLLTMSILCAATQFNGLLAEHLFFVSDLARVAKWVHAIGWLTMGGAYGIIFHYYFLSLSMADNGPPVFVHVVVLLIAALYMSFGLVQVLQIWNCRRELRCACTQNENARTCCCFSDNENEKETGELWYVCLSLVAKTILGWMLYANLLVMASESTCDPFRS